MLVFLTSLTLHLYITSIGWNYPILDAHAFRQTQTAITSYYFLRDGFRLGYQTPVLGAPWSIPLEFPLYQGLVATVVKLTGYPLDQSGRLVSVVFFYASLLVGYYLLGLLQIAPQHRLIFLALILASPLYLFWSRTFMIESLALFLTLLFLYFSLRWLQKKKLALVTAAIIFGSLAGLTKVSTLVVGLVAISFLLVVYLRSLFVKKNWLMLITLLLLISIPILTSVVWTIYTDRLKAQNALAANFLTSFEMRYWNFGNTKQRLVLDTWQRFLDTTEEKIIGTRWLLVGLATTLLFAKRYRLQILLSSLIYLSGLVIFTNLYYVHDYYFYANGIYLLAALGFGLLNLLEQRSLTALTIFIVLPTIIGIFLVSYKKSYYPQQADSNLAIPDLGHIIERAVPGDKVLLIYGYDWSSEIPYYAKRKAIMDHSNYSLHHPKMQRIITATGQDNIVAMLVRYPEKKFISERLAYFGFAPEPVFQNELGALFVKTADYLELRQQLWAQYSQLLLGTSEPLVIKNLTAPIPVQRKIYQDKFVLLLHAPGELQFVIPTGRTVFQSSFGLLPLAYKHGHSDGVTFQISLLEKNRVERNVYAKRLDPQRDRQARNQQELTLSLPNTCPCELILHTLPGDSESWDLSYWSNITLK